MNKIDEWVTNGPGEGTLYYFEERGNDSHPIEDIGYKSLKEALIDLNTITSKTAYPGAVVLKGSLRKTKRVVTKPSKISKFLLKEKTDLLKLYIENFSDIESYPDVIAWKPIENPYPKETPNLRYFFHSGKNPFDSEPGYWNYLLVVPKVYLKDEE